MDLPIGRTYLVAALILLFLAPACSSADPTSTSAQVEKDAILDLVCWAAARADCLSILCDQAGHCPVVSALSSQPIFDFVATYSACPDCSTPDLPPGTGIGKCIETLVSESSTAITVSIWVSENCSFRYGSPQDSVIDVVLAPGSMKIEDITPPVGYITDPLYCQVETDCMSLSGSGVPFIGCSNYFHATLNWSGYYPGNECDCRAGQCTAK